jgi:hypothetical protein
VALVCSSEDIPKYPYYHNAMNLMLVIRNRAIDVHDDTLECDDRLAYKYMEKRSPLNLMSFCVHRQIRSIGPCYVGYHTENICCRNPVVFIRLHGSLCFDCSTSPSRRCVVVASTTFRMSWVVWTVYENHTTDINLKSLMNKDKALSTAHATFHIVIRYCILVVQ